jgi:hypothetical protein
MPLLNPVTETVPPLTVALPAAVVELLAKVHEASYTSPVMGENV